MSILSYKNVVQDVTHVHIFRESGLLKHLKPYDLDLADRGFTVQDLLNPLQVQ